MPKATPQRRTPPLPKTEFSTRDPHDAFIVNSIEVACSWLGREEIEEEDAGFGFDSMVIRIESGWIIFGQWKV
jgi:hypothetical protein